MQNGKKQYTYLMREIQESIINRMFILSVAGILVCLVLDNVDYIPLIWKKNIQEINVLLYLRSSLSNGFYGLFVIPLMAALPYSLGYYRDVRAGITGTVISKTGLTIYCIGKMIAAFLSGFLSCVCGIGIFTAFLSCFRPLGVREQAVEYEDWPFGGYYISERYVTYLLIRLLLFGIWCGIWCLVALCISAYMQNASVVLASVTVFLFCWNTFNNLLPVNVSYRPSCWFSCTYGLDSDTKTIVGCVLFTRIMLSISWLVFYRKVKQNLYTG